MKILFFHRWVGVHHGGTESHIKEMALRLAKRGHTIHILTRDGNELRDLEHMLKIWRVTKNRGESDFSHMPRDIRLYVYFVLFLIKSFLKLLVIKLKGINYDIVSVHFITEAYLMRLIRPLFGWPYVFTLEGYTDAEAREARYANLQIAISRHEVEACLKNYGYEPLLIPKGVDLDRFNPNIDGADIKKRFCRQDEKLVLTVCRLEPRKDISTLILAAKILSRKDSKIKFIIVGDGISRMKIEKQIADLGLSEKMILERNVSDEQLPRFYRACDLFVLPTFYEGFGWVFLEAMACGIPIISNTVGAVPEVVGDAGVLLAPKNPELLAEKISELIYDKGLCQVLIEKGLERVKFFDWNRLIVEKEKAYAKAIAQFSN